MIVSLTYAINSATPKIMSAVEPSCTVSPLTRHWMRSACGSPTSSRGTTRGPIGQNVSSDFARVHCPSANWSARAETSFRHV